MKEKVIYYRHHGVSVFSRESTQGKHREMCLCHICKRFQPDRRELNCHIANRLYKIDVKFNLVTPVFECPIFEQREDS